MDTCLQCGRPVAKDEIGLTRKLVNRGCESFLCIHCLAARFGVSVQLLEQKIEQFRQAGCTLFL